MNEILIAYEKNKATYDAFSKTLAALIDNLMLAEGIKIHSVTCRVKEKESLEKKVSSKDKYTSINEITDIVGLRIITHFADEVDEVAALIEREFFVDKKNTIDKRASLEPEKFGYLSLHYVISLTQDRLGFFEYKSYAGLKAEIQIRSILQHTWAEIEHDIGYKSSVEVPKVIKRQFSRLAGLLELADQEFLAIKTSLNEYQSKVSQNIWSSKSEDFKIDKVTLREFLKKSKIVQEIIDDIKKHCDVHFNPEADYTGPAIEYLNKMDINSTRQLESAFKKYKTPLINRSIWIMKKFSESFVTSRPLEVIAIYLPQVMAFEMRGIDGLRNYITETLGEAVKEMPAEYFEDFPKSIESSDQNIQ
ncbi:GTP pyrophosphokinase family protein [Pantoea sp. ANP04]|uniref:GTP pyrophosphokinase family protein n=1 Tax=Pantoea sp. ANP04 TaxID=3064896 RepID=UPI0035C62DEE